MKTPALNRRLYKIYLYDINSNLICTLRRFSYLPRHLFLAHTQAKVERGNFGKYANRISFTNSNLVKLPVLHFSGLTL